MYYSYMIFLATTVYNIYSISKKNPRWFQKICSYVWGNNLYSNYQIWNSNFKLPGGLDSKGKINLLTSQFCIDSPPFLRYKSSKQNNVASGSLMRDYKDTLNNLFSFHTNDLPNITFDQWKEWAHINGN